MSRKLQFDNVGIATVIAQNDRAELDDLVTVSVIDRDLTAPPAAAPSNGDRYIPAATATGDWAGRENNIAFWNGYWAFIAPTRNMRAWLEDELVWIEYNGTAWVHVPPAMRNVVAKTADYTVLQADNGTVFTNTGATGEVRFTLPPAVVGLEYIFYVGAAFDLTIVPDTGDFMPVAATGVPGTVDHELIANLAGETMHLICCLADNWNTVGNVGTWTVTAP